MGLAPLQVIELGNVVPHPKRLPSIETGVNETYHGHIDVGSQRYKAYIKLLGTKQLINELLATTIGRNLGLPIPRGFLVRVRPSDIPDSEPLKLHGAEALAFATSDAKHPSLYRRFKGDEPAVMEWLRNNFKRWDDGALFDEWIANVDRHFNNLLVGRTGEVQLIDHDQCFSGAAWKAGDLKPSQAYPNRLADMMIPKLALAQRVKLKEKAASFCPALSAVDVSKVCAASMTDKLLTSDDLAAVMAFLRDRIAHFESIVATRVGLPMLGGIT